MKDDTISRAAAIDALIKRDPNCGIDSAEVIKALPSARPGCEDTVPRASVKYICRKNTVSTNPYEHKYHDKFIQFMDDPEISDFGRWQHSNGFNTALVAVECDLDKVPSVTPNPWKVGKRMNKIVFLDDVIKALFEKGQSSKRYKLGERWELNGVEIREALDTVPEIDLKIAVEEKF